MIKTYLFAYLIAGFCCQAIAQSDTSAVEYITLPVPQSKYYPKSRMVGLNMTPLLTQLAPFNRANPQNVGPYLMRFKNYKRNKMAFRFGMGILIEPDNSIEDETNNFMNLQIGFESRKNFTERWSFTRGFEFLILAGNQNLPGQASRSSFNIGFGFPWGIEYALAPRVSLSTEAELIIVGGTSPTIKVIPPIGLFLNYYFSKPVE